MHRPVPKWPSVPTETKTSTYFICRIRRRATLSAQLRKLSGSVGAWPTPPRFAVSCNYPFFCSSERKPQTQYLGFSPAIDAKICRHTNVALYGHSHCHCGSATLAARWLHGCRRRKHDLFLARFSADQRPRKHRIETDTCAGSDNAGSDTPTLLWYSPGPSNAQIPGHM